MEPSSGDGRRARVGVAGEAEQFLGDVPGRQDVIDVAVVNGATGHAAVPGRLVVLREGDAPLGLDRLASERPVGPTAGKHHADGPRLVHNG